MECVICGKKISKRAFGLSCDMCEEFFHSKCANLNKERFAEIVDKDLEWNCDKCREKRRMKRISVYNEEAAESSLSSSGDKNIVEDINSSYAAVISELKKIAEAQKIFEKSLSTFSLLIDDLNDKIRCFESRMKVVDKLVDENIELKKTVTSLNCRLSEVEQCSRMNDVEISGIPERKGENLSLVMQSIGVAVNCPITEKDIDVLHRVQCFDKKKTKNIIIRFHSRQLKNKLVACSRIHVRKNGLLKMENINYDGTGIFYVNEHLMPERKLLYLKAKKFCKENNVKYIWVKDCKILARKADNTKVQLISSLEDLQNII